VGTSSNRPRGRAPARVPLTAIAGVALLLGALKLLHGCGGSMTPSTDAIDSGGDAPADSVVAIHCDPGAQTGCGAGEKCDVFCSPTGPEFGCRKDEGTLQPGQPCAGAMTVGTQSCAKGSTCASTTRGTLCTKPCTDDASCGTGKCVTVSALYSCLPNPAMNKPFSLSICQ
jgi:hypothetical protein